MKNVFRFALCAAVSAAFATAAYAQATHEARPNVLEGQAACEGYTTENFRERYAANAAGQEAQRHAFCAAAYAYYRGYLNAVAQGYAQADTDRTYDAYLVQARNAQTFFEQYR